ncbi:NF038130 family PEP-CTERM protein [Moorena producens JHB]|uniref:NF038130 family PEP-CTERM protein n=1 Tax=Moorena producens (strain JHB) TaxID=1454205 RepID=A0A1D9FVT2_MOOP1|nr:NF038130 family PEP-CTERM protein [Moorena producens]AOY79423.1 NF038130 family PEP-CTERM protein [Moorena producens JHB]
MKSTVMKMWLGASILAGISGIATTPAVAGSLTGATLIGSDYYKIASDGTETFIDQNAILSTILQGDASDPGGNVELFASSETLTNSQFDNYTDVTSLTGQIGGKDITLSSLTLADWESDLDSDGITLGKEWVSDALTAHGLGYYVNNVVVDTFYTLFSDNGGLQRFSDPNISYVNQNATGHISIGLAGHLDARDAFEDTFDQLEQMIALLSPGFQLPLPPSIRASEIVKVEYNGKTEYLYGFIPTASGLVSREDGISHNATYQVAFLGTPPGPSSSEPQPVPESSTVLGLIAVGGLFTAGRKLQKSNC